MKVFREGLEGLVLKDVKVTREGLEEFEESVFKRRLGKPGRLFKSSVGADQKL